MKARQLFPIGHKMQNLGISLVGRYLVVLTGSAREVATRKLDNYGSLNSVTPFRPAFLDYHFIINFAEQDRRVHPSVCSAVVDGSSFPMFLGSSMFLAHLVFDCLQ